MSAPFGLQKNSGIHASDKSPHRLGCLLILTLALCFTGANGFSADAVDEAVAKGVAYLIGQQDSRGAVQNNGTHETAMTSLTLLTLAAVGHQPTDPSPEGLAARRALEFLLSPSQQDQNGYFGARDNSRMYGHGITALALSALLGMGVSAEQDAKLRSACEKAVELILRAQSAPKLQGHEGGWRYTPVSTDSDLSVSIWQLMALRSAKDAGLRVPKDAIEKAADYIGRSHVPSATATGGAAGFRYQPGSSPVWSNAAEGLLALQVSGKYEAEEVRDSADWLLVHPPDAAKAQTLWFYYGTYYYAQGLYQRGGRHAEEATRIVPEVLLPLQNPDGSWRQVSNYERSRVYCTTMALLSLSVKYHYLPIYQR